MQDFYITMNIFTSLTLLVMTMLVYENSRFDKKTKLRFYLTYFLIAAAMLAEWGGILLNGAPAWTVGLHRWVKCLDYILTPAAGVAIIALISKNDFAKKCLDLILGINILLQCLSIFTGWTFYVDAENIYHHGQGYAVYGIIYVITILGILIEFYLYGKKYSKQNRGSLFAIIMLLITGVLLKEIFGQRITYLTLAVCAVFLFVHYSEFSQLTSDANLQYQKKLLEIDVLSGLYSRYAYTDALKELERLDNLSEQLVVFSMDINELKNTNDELGHLAGDELIQGAADCIRRVLENYGKCYRTGGDEFIAFLYLDDKKAYELIRRLEEETGQWSGVLVDHLSLSAGYAEAKGYPNEKIEKLIMIADEKMYEAKAHFYMQQNKKRRKSEQRGSEDIEKKQKEYIDIITALSRDVNGLYVIDRKKREVTAYRISVHDHSIRSGVPLEEGFETSMDRFIHKIVHPDDCDMMSRSVQVDYMERELAVKGTFSVHFRSLTEGEVHFHCMKCIRNYEGDEFDKIIISFSPEDNHVSRRKIQEVLKTKETREKQTILIAEAGEADRKQLQEYLSGDYSVLEAENGEHALALLRREIREISIVLYDQNLPGMDAAAFLQKIRKDAFLSCIPVIVMTDNKDEGMINRCDALGAAEFVIKPLRKVMLNSRINRVIRMKAAAATLDQIEIDDLTGLYTKQAFFYHASTLINASPDEQFSIVISDIQDFKMFNSIYGEKKGDDVLKMLGDYILRTVVNGICARYDADQFVAVIKTPSTGGIRRYIANMQNYVNEECSENFVLKFGIYENLDRNLGIARACDRALIALKSIKHNYDIPYAFFDGPVSQQQYRAQIFEAQFRNAIEKEEFVIWYQPKFNPYTDKVVGAEALVRWKRDDGTVISPGEFLPVFEKDGLVGQLDEYVFRKVCAHQKKWKDRGKDLIPISVNLSRNSMHQINVVKRYKAIADEYGIAPEMLPIEITESAAVETIEIKPLADAFYEAGFPLHMDDFGSGKSSLTGLNLLHFDVIKLDKSLIDYIGDEHGNLVLMYTVAMSRELGLHLVAEGVETVEQLDYLRDSGCDAVQGYYYCRPLPADEFEKKVEDNLETKTTVYDYRYKMTESDSIVKRTMNRIVQRMPGGFLTYRRDNNQIILSNRYLWNLFGCENEREFMNYVGGTFQGVVCPEDLEYVQQYIDKQLNEGHTDMDYVEYSILRKDGKKIPVVDYGYLDHQHDGDIFYVFISEVDK